MKKVRFTIKKLALLVLISYIFTLLFSWWKHYYPFVDSLNKWIDNQTENTEKLQMSFSVYDEELKFNNSDEEKIKIYGQAIIENLIRLTNEVSSDGVLSKLYRYTFFSNDGTEIFTYNDDYLNAYKNLGFDSFKEIPAFKKVSKTTKKLVFLKNNDKWLINSDIYCPIIFGSNKSGIILLSLNLNTIASMCENLTELNSRLRNSILFDTMIYILLLLFYLFYICIKLGTFSKQVSKSVDKDGRILNTTFVESKSSSEIGDLSRSFSTLINKLNEQMQSVEANTSDMVHEFKNPLAAIRSSMELLDFDDISGEERKEILASVHSELKHLEILLNDIRAHSKIQNLNNEADKENVPVGILTENIVSRIQKNYPAVDFTFNCESREDSIFAKPENLDKMIGNLIENAASFAVNSEKKQVLVRVKCMKDINRVKTIMHITVEDSGPGVPESETEKIFGRYYSHREDNQRKSHSGLGLSMVKAVADSLNGSITVLRSGKLGGAKFVVSIPLFEDVEVIEEKHSFLFSRKLKRRNSAIKKEKAEIRKSFIKLYSEYKAHPEVYIEDIRSFMHSKDYQPDKNGIDTEPDSNFPVADIPLGAIDQYFLFKAKEEVNVNGSSS
ncbi:MAG: GHKL domain-containing protein [Treponema sp.]|nr:GHKL domain-containing protein [Candidatus Treponema equifaecale]